MNSIVNTYYSAREYQSHHKIKINNRWHLCPLHYVLETTPMVMISKHKMMISISSDTKPDAYDV